jgi:hypothetical protein
LGEKMRAKLLSQLNGLRLASAPETLASQPFGDLDCGRMQLNYC